MISIKYVNFIVVCINIMSNILLIEAESMLSAAGNCNYRFPTISCIYSLCVCVRVCKTNIIRNKNHSCEK